MHPKINKQSLFWIPVEQNRLFLVDRNPNNHINEITNHTAHHNWTYTLQYKIVLQRGYYASLTTKYLPAIVSNITKLFRTRKLGIARDKTCLLRVNNVDCITNTNVRYLTNDDDRSSHMCWFRQSGETKTMCVSLGDRRGTSGG